MRHSKTVLAAAVVGAMALSGCSTGDSPETNGTPTYDEPVDLTLTTWSSAPAIHEMWQTLADEFREENPEMGELTIQLLPIDSYTAQIAIQLHGNDAPDLGWISTNDFRSWADSGILYSLDELKSDPAWEWDKVLPNLVDGFETEDEGLLAYPAVNTVHPVFYNKDVFEQAGVETPRELLDAGEWTWDNLRRIAKEAVDAGAATYGLDIPQYSFIGMPNYISRGFGAVYWPDATQCGLVDEATIDTVNYLRGMIFDDQSFKQPGATPNFPTGDTAMAITSPSYMAQLADTSFEWDVVPQPRGDVAYNPQLAQASIGVFSAGQAPELAARLLAYITGPRGADVQASVFIPARSTDLERAQEIMVEANPRVSAESIQTAVIEPLSVATPDEVLERGAEVSSAINPILDGLWVPNSDVERVLSAACEAAEPFLE